MADRIQVRGDSQVNWELYNPVLADRELALTTDSVPIQMKVGNGVDSWSALPYSITFGNGIIDKTFVLVQDVPPGKWYSYSRKFLQKAIVDFTSVPVGAVTILIKSQLGSSDPVIAATLSGLTTVYTTIDLGDVYVAAGSRVWAECSNLQGGGTCSVALIMESR